MPDRRRVQVQPSSGRARVVVAIGLARAVPLRRRPRWPCAVYMAFTSSETSSTAHSPSASRRRDRHPERALGLDQQLDEPMLHPSAGAGRRCACRMYERAPLLTCCSQRRSAPTSDGGLEPTACGGSTLALDRREPGREAGLTGRRPGSTELAFSRAHAHGPHQVRRGGLAATTPDRYEAGSPRSCAGPSSTTPGSRSASARERGGKAAGGEDARRPRRRRVIGNAKARALLVSQPWDSPRATKAPPRPAPGRRRGRRRAGCCCWPRLPVPGSARPRTVTESGE